MTRTMEIYFDDLNNDAKERLLQFENVATEDELNHEFFPLFILEREEEDEG